MKKIIIIGLIGMLGAAGTQAAQNFSIADGNWTNEATWSTPYIPSYAHWTYVQDGFTVTVDSYAETDWLFMDTLGGSLVLESGADLQLLSGSQRVQLNGSSTLTVNTGAQLSTTYLMIGDKTAGEGTVVVNDGTVISSAGIWVGEPSGSSSISTLNVNGGFVQAGTSNVQQIVVLGGGAGSVATVNVTGGTLQCAYPAMQPNATVTMTIDGGELVITTQNPNGSLGFYAASQKIFYESGAIIWQGVDDLAEFNSFANAFNGWVDSTNLTSATLSPEQLKYNLQFIDGSGAVLSLAPKAFPAIPDPIVNLIANGDFRLTANEDDTLHPGATEFNVNGTFGDYSAHTNRTADVVDWTPYYADPNGLVPAVGTPHVIDGNGELDGTWYLDTLINTNTHSMLLNSSMNYRNGMKQEDILNGVTIDSGKTYTLAVAAQYSDIGEDYSTSPFTVALTAGSGVAVTNPANVIAGSLLTGDLAFWNGVQSTAVSGADLLAAGQVNVGFEIESSFVIPGFPGGAPDPLDLTVVAQVRVSSVSLYEPFVQQLGDLNKDGQVNQADVDLANSYLDGSIDPLGADDAATRQAALVADGMTGPEALAYLNLTAFDIDGNGTFDAADVTALQALVPPLTILSTVLDGSIMTVEVGGLNIGTGYSLMKDTNLASAPSFDVIADSITAASEIETLTDTNAIDGQAFYKIMEQ